MMQRIADWHGEQACVYYQKWTRTEDEKDLQEYCRHVSKADRMWAVLARK